MPYEFTVDAFGQFSEDILKAEGDQATLTSLLADMQGTFSDAVAKDIAATEKVTTVTAENERLKKANMELFLRVGSRDDTKAKEADQPQEEEHIDTKTYMSRYFEKLDAK